MPALMFVFVDPAPGKEAEFNAWYDDEHAAEALATPGMVSLARYRLSDVSVFPGTELQTSRWVSVYEIDGDTDEDFERVATALRKIFLGGNETAGKHIAQVDLAPTMDMTTLTAGFAATVTPRRTLEQARDLKAAAT